MNYKKFKRQENLLLSLLTDLGVIDTDVRIITIDIDPDDSISPYSREDFKDYYFVHSFSFKLYFKSLVKAEFLKTRVYDTDSLREGVEECEDIDCSEISENVEYALDQINRKDFHFFTNYGYDTDELDGYKLHEVRVQNIDNIKQKVYYEGGYLGGDIAIDAIICGYNTYAKISMMGIVNNLSDFYKELMGESFVIFCNQNYKMAFFVAFTAFECFINSIENTETINSHLSDKIKQLYKKQLGDLSKHEIYCSVISEFSNYEKKRNDIAHGNQTSCINIAEEEAREFLIFCLTMIVIYNKQPKDFDVLLNDILGLHNK